MARGLTVVERIVEQIGGIIAIFLALAIALVGGLLLTGNAVLYSETGPLSGTTSAGINWTVEGGFSCRYFTGTRTIEIETQSQTGCPRFIKVGE